jgi:hypothetical protein
MNADIEAIASVLREQLPADLVLTEARHAGPVATSRRVARQARVGPAVRGTVAVPTIGKDIGPVF